MVGVELVAVDTVKLTEQPAECCTAAAKVENQ